MAQLKGGTTIGGSIAYHGTNANLSTIDWCANIFCGSGAGLTGTAASLNVNYATTAGSAPANGGTANNSTCLGGLLVHAGVNDEPNKIVRTQANGYLHVGYICSLAGNEGNNSSPARVWGTNGSDSYLRTYLTSALNVSYATNSNYATTAGSAPANGGTSTYTGWVNPNTSLVYGYSGLQYFNISGVGIVGTNPLINQTPDTNWWHIIRGNHANAQGYYADLAIGMTTTNAELQVRKISAGSGSAWVKMIDSNTIGSQSVNYAASAGQATVANDSYCLGGYNSATCILSPVVCATTAFRTTGTGYRYCGGTGCGTAVDWIATSDCRIKKCVEPIMNALSMVDALCGVCYELCENNTKDMGLIAQDVFLVEPRLVAHSEPIEEYKKYGIEDEVLSLKYDKFAGLFVEAIKEQQVIINKLENRIKMLEDEKNI